MKIQRVVFDHIPKTGGQAINSWLRRELGAEIVSPNYFFHEHRKVLKKEFPVIHSHIVFNPYDGLDPNWKYVTCLRKPVDRAMSWLSYCINGLPGTSENAALKSGAKTFFETNGEDSTPEFFASISDFYTNHFVDLYEYDIVGIYEDFPAYLKKICVLFDIPIVEHIPVVNPTIKVVGGIDIVHAIAALNQQDLLLYEKLKSI